MATLTIQGRTSGIDNAATRTEKAVRRVQDATKAVEQATNEIASRWQRATAAALQYRRAALRAAEAGRGGGGTTNLIGGTDGRTAFAQVTQQTRAATQQVQQMRAATVQAALAANKYAQQIERAAKAAQKARSALGPASGRGGAALLPGAGGGVVPSVSAPSRRSTPSFGSQVGDLTGRVARIFTGSLGLAVGSVFGPAGIAIGLIGTTLARAFSAITGTITRVIAGAFRTAVGVLSTGLKVAFGVAAAAAVLSIREASRREPLQAAFAATTSSRGLGDADQVLGRLRRAALGTIDDTQLILNANTALFLGAAKTTEQIEFLTVAGRRLGEAFGRTASEGFNDLSIGIGRQSRLILDNLGLIVRVGEANDAYARAVGKSASELTEQETKLAFQVAAYRAVAEGLRSLGKEQDTTSKSFSRLFATVRNFAADFAAPVLGPLREVLDRWSGFLASFRPGELRDVLSRAFAGAREVVSGFLGAIPGAGSVAGVGGSLAEAITEPSRAAFAELRVRFEDLVSNAITLFANLWDKFAEFGAGAINKVLGPLQGLANVGESVQNLPGIAGLRSILSGDVGRSILDTLPGIGLLAPDGPPRQVVNPAAFQANRSFISPEDTEARIRAARESAAREDRRREALTVGAFLSGRGPLGQLGRPQSPIPDSIQNSNAARVAVAQADALLESAKAAEQVRVAFESTVQQVGKLNEAAAKLVADGLRDQIRETERVTTSLGGLSTALDAPIKALQDALGVTRDLSFSERVEEIVGPLSSLGDALQSLNQQILDEVQTRAQIVREGLALEQEARQEYADTLRREARSFLLGPEVEGTSVRVRSIQRRARREQSRQRADALNQAFGSRGFSSIQGVGGFSGFGAQNVERAGGILDQRFPLLEQALATLTRDDGSTILAEFTVRLAAIADETAALKAESLTKQAELNLQVEEAETEQRELERKGNDLLDQLLGIVQRQQAEVEANKARQAALERKLQEVEARARRLAKR